MREASLLHMINGRIKVHDAVESIKDYVLCDSCHSEIHNFFWFMTNTDEEESSEFCIKCCDERFPDKSKDFDGCLKARSFSTQQLQYMVQEVSKIAGYLHPHTHPPDVHLVMADPDPPGINVRGPGPARDVDSGKPELETSPPKINLTGPGFDNPMNWRDYVVSGNYWPFCSEDPSSGDDSFHSKEWTAGTRQQKKNFHVVRKWEIQQALKDKPAEERGQERYKSRAGRELSQGPPPEYDELPGQQLFHQLKKPSK